VPIYEYECQGGHRFERYKQMQDRHDASCPECDKPVRLRISVPCVALKYPPTPLPVYLHDGTKIHEFSHAPAIRPPTPPEELVRLGELANNPDRFEPQKAGT